MRGAEESDVDDDKGWKKSLLYGGVMTENNDKGPW